MANILLIDDDAEVLTINKKYLSGEGHKVYATTDPDKGIQFIKKSSLDCIILDIMMPGIDGYEACRKIRVFSTVPIIFLTGKSSEDDKIDGFMMGADDYIVKPYSLRELKARIEVLLRRSGQQTVKKDSHILQFGNLQIDQIAHKAYFKDKDLCLANREYEVLLFMATHSNKEITFEELGTTLFGTYQKDDRRIVMVNVSRLRKKMNIDFELENLIETVWSRGYRFIVK